MPTIVRSVARPGSASAPVLILSAWEPEIAPLRLRLDRASARPRTRASAGALASARARPHAGAPTASAVVCRTVGVGAIDAAASAARAIADVRPACVIFIGTAGSYPGAGRGAPIGGVKIPDDFALVSTALLRQEGYAPAPMIVRAPAAPALMAELRRAAGVATAASGAASPLVITRSAALGRRIAAMTATELENLEVFSVARAAALASVPFAAVLGIANRVGPRAHAEWLRHHQAASRAACAALWAWLRRQRHRPFARDFG
jgi:nucleoside phosphorylase